MPSRHISRIGVSIDSTCSGDCFEWYPMSKGTYRICSASGTCVPGLLLGCLLRTCGVHAGMMLISGCMKLSLSWMTCISHVQAHAVGIPGYAADVMPRQDIQLSDGHWSVAALTALIQVLDGILKLRAQQRFARPLL